MKIQRFLATTLTASLLAVASVEVAAADFCSGGVISDQTVVDDIIVLAGQSCIIEKSTVFGEIVANGAVAVVLSENDVESRIRIENTQFVAIADTVVDDGNIAVLDNGLVRVRDNRTNRGNIYISRNGEATVNRNSAEVLIVCLENGTLNSFFNRAEEDLCPPNNL